MLRAFGFSVTDDNAEDKPPEGIESLEGVVANAKPNATVTMPAAWVRQLLAYLRRLESSVEKPGAGWGSRG